MVFAAVVTTGALSDVQPARDPAATREARLAGPVEDALKANQFDGDEHGDASDDCLAPAPRVYEGVGTSGMVVPRVDDADYFALEIEQARLFNDGHVGFKVAPGAEKLTIRVLSPGCERVVSTPNGAFSPQELGVHTVAVKRASAVAGEHERVCHDFCFKRANDVVGYAFNITFS